MALLKQILETYLSTVKEANIEGAESLIAATPNNQHKSAFSLIQNIHGSDLTTTDVTNHLKNVDDAEEEVDTVAFGLETTDGKIVKVYVNAEEAEAFEDKMSQLLGKIDDIDQAIEELSDEFDVVRVVKPDDLESEGGEEQEVDPSIGIENALDEPLGDDDVVVDMDDEDLIADPDAEDKPKDGEDEDKKDDEEGGDKGDEEDKKDDEEDKGDGLDFGVDPAPEDGEDKPEDEEDKPEGDEEDKPEDEEKPEDEDDAEGEDKPEGEEDDPKDDPKKDKKKKEKKPSKDDKDSKMKQEGTNSILKQLLALNEAKHVKAVHAKPKKEEPKKEEPKPAKSDGEGDTSADIFHLSLTKDEAELEQIFANPIQQLIYRTVLLLGVNADQINIRKFKVRKSVKEVSVVIQHHPQIKNILSKLGRDLASKKSEIHAIAEAVEEKDGAPLTGTIKDQLSTEISKKIYDLILALGVPEFLLTYKKTAFRARIKNLAKIAVKHSRIKNYIYTLCDLLKAPKSAVREGFEQALEAQVIEATQKEEPKFVSKGLLEDFSSTNNVADLGTFSVTSMGKVGGTTLKVKDFSIELDDEQFEKFVGLLGDGKSGVVKSENLGKINVIALAHGKEYVVKKIKPSENDKYAFGVLISKKSIDKILG